MADIERAQKQLVSYIQNMLGSTPETQRISSDKSRWTKDTTWEKKLSFDILSFRNFPQEGITTYVTSGLSEYVLRDDQNGQKPRRVELISALRDDTDFEELTGDIGDKKNFYEDSLLYFCCYMVIKNSYIFPGDIWNRWFINIYEQFSDMEHLFFPTPTLLTNKIQSTTIEGKEIEFLLCVPISDEELKYYEKSGPEELEKLLLRSKVDITDLFRESVI